MAVPGFIPNVWEAQLLESLRRAARFSGYDRKRREVGRTPPTEEEKAQHARALELWGELKDNPFFALDDEGVFIREPRDHIEWEYAETEAEWRQRVGIDGNTITLRTVLDQAE